jgi:predicted DCC family thiol-disulfide oxidoreductase YuxK
MRSVAEPPTLLFDGTCNLCNGTVQFVIDHDRGDIRFAALQSDFARERLEKLVGADEATKLRAGATGEGDPDSLVFIDDEKVYVRSRGALEMARHLRAPWSWLGFLGRLVPRFVSDVVYRWIARNRYRWFGKSETCRVPTPELRARFLA